MKIKVFILSLGLLLGTRTLCAQSASDGRATDFRTRTSIGADWKIVKGLHLKADYELRTEDKLSRVSSNRLSAGLRYSPVKHLSIETGYSYIGQRNSDKELKPRHRVYLGATGSYKAGDWKFSLQETLQMTHKSYDFNVYQNTPNLLELKSRLKASYRGFSRIEPYACAELRNCFNGPSFDDGFAGYDDGYLNRVRASLGMEWELDKHNALDFRLISDWCSDKDIDANAEGTKLKTMAWDKSLNVSLAVGYVFSF